MPHNLSRLLQLLEQSRAAAGSPHAASTLFENYEAKRRMGPAAQVGTPPTPVIYTLTVDCVAGAHLAGPCQRVLEMRSDSSLDELHLMIQRAVAFDNDHMFEFFIGRHERNRKLTFAEEDDEEGAAGDIQLRRIWPLPKGTDLYYWFDFGDDWKFRIRKAHAVHPPAKGIAYPRLVKKTGRNPEQYPDCD